MPVTSGIQHRARRLMQSTEGLAATYWQSDYLEDQYIPRILWKLEVHYHIHSSLPPVPTLTKSIHSSAHHIFDRRSLFPSWSG